jgi:hypothetical protein
LPYVTNPTGWDLYCHPLQRSLAPYETVRVDDAEAASAISDNVMVISATDPNAETRPTTRKTVKRGTRTVETTEATPAAEVR